MNKNTQILLGVGALAVVGYLVWKNNQGKKANASGKANQLMQYSETNAWQDACTKCYKDVVDLGNGDFVYTCNNGNHATKIKDGVKPCK